MEETDAQLHLKKRARRRLVGAVAFVALVAIVLPMVMDHEPRQVAQDVEIRIPGQDEKPFAPKFAAPPADKPIEKALEPPLEPRPVEKAVEKPVEPSRPAPVAELSAKVPSAEKASEKPPAKAPEKPSAKFEKAVVQDTGSDARRAAAILAGKTAEPAANGGEHVILIGAFSSDGNVKTIRSKLGELGIKAYTEPLDSPQGRKTRVRAGPFPNREAAEKALEKMKRIGVSGVVAAR